MDLRLKDKKVSNDSRWEQRGVELPGGSAESIALSLLSRLVPHPFLQHLLFLCFSLILPSCPSTQLSLLRRVGSGRLPPADQLTWLVSRDEVDQVSLHER